MEEIHCIVPNKVSGPDHIPNEVIMHANEEEKEFIRIWANEILTFDASIDREMSEDELRGTIRMMTIRCLYSLYFRYTRAKATRTA